jgi:hypothetical protein
VRDEPKRLYGFDMTDKGESLVELVELPDGAFSMTSSVWIPAEDLVDDGTGD